MSSSDVSSLVQSSDVDTSTSDAQVSPVALHISDLRKSFDGKEVVCGLSLEAHRGEITAVLGPNGAGKTTTIECCEGLRSQDSGEIRIFGLDPATDGSQLRHRVGVMLQDGGLPNSVRALDMLKHVATLYEHPWDVSDLVARLGIDSFAKTSVRRLSGGQRQRLALAAALVGRPQLLFLDEPSAGMDPQSRHAVWALIRELRDQGAAVLLTTHLMDEAQALSDKVYIVDHGRVIASGKPSELGSTDTNQITFTTDRPIDLDQLVENLGESAQVGRRATGAIRINGLDAPGGIATLATFCANEGVTITSLTTGAANLEDVFLELTGRNLR